jgi:hypothetical protein
MRGSRLSHRHVTSGSRSSLDQVSSRSRWSGLGQVPVKSWASPRRVQVSINSQAGLSQVLTRSSASFGKVRQFENKMLKVEKLFTIFKTINHFSKIKEFRSKGKCFSLTIILHRTQHRKMRKSFAHKPFYVERNGA